MQKFLTDGPLQALLGKAVGGGNRVALLVILELYVHWFTKLFTDNLPCLLGNVDGVSLYLFQKGIIQVFSVHG
jgi:hypothetical protein